MANVLTIQEGTDLLTAEEVSIRDNHLVIPPAINYDLIDQTSKKVAKSARGFITTMLTACFLTFGVVTGVSLVTSGKLNGDVDVVTLAIAGVAIVISIFAIWRSASSILGVEYLIRLRNNFVQANRPTVEQWVKEVNGIDMEEKTVEDLIYTVYGIKPNTEVFLSVDKESSYVLKEEDSGWVLVKV